MSEYTAKELVYAYHGPMLYKARVLQIRDDPEKPYRVHYHGWNKKFDEWLAPNRVMKITDESTALVEKLKIQFVDTKPKIIKKLKGNKSSDPDLISIPKTNTTLFFGIPDVLKEILINDREQIIVDHSLASYEYTLNDIIRDYKKTIKMDEFYYLNEFLDGLVVYFNLALPKQLLYLFERPHWLSFESQKPVASDIYGLQHFLRMFTILPSLMPLSNLNEGLREEFQQFTEDLLEWLSGHLEYVGDYNKASNDYIAGFQRLGINI